VPRLGAKAFVQAAGFLRIRDGENPLDASAVHPESYEIVDAMANDLGCSLADLMRDDALRKQIDLARYVTEEVGLPTLNDILTELAKPGRDPRENFEAFRFAEGVEKLEDLKPGMKLPGIVTNLTAFGAFVDIGVHQDGLVHLSQIADRFVKDPGEVLKVRQIVEATVLAVDLERKRISLTLKKERASDQTGGESQPKPEKDRLVIERAGGTGQGQTAQGRPSREKPAPDPSPRKNRDRGKPGPGRPERGRPREEKVPFNNPFAAVFGKK